MTNKLLSIVVPSYNMEKYLPKCLDSLIVDDEIKFHQLDVIVVNDGSKDRTSEIAHDFAVRFPGVFRVVDKPNGNYGSCVNAAIPLVRGEFVKILDADDYFDRKGLVLLLEHLDNRGAGVDLVITDYDEVNAEGLELRHCSFEDVFPISTAFPLSCFIPQQPRIQMQGYTYRTSILRELNYRQCEGVSYSDTEWVIVPLLAVKTVSYLHQMVYCYLKGREGQTMDPAVRRKTSWMQAEVSIHACCQIRSALCGHSVSTKTILSRMAGDAIVAIYRGALLKSGVFANIDITRFDRRLQEESPDVYAETGDARYSSRLPYRFVLAWRRRAWHWQFMRQVCACYTNVACAFAGVRTKNACKGG